MEYKVESKVGIKAVKSPGRQKHLLLSIMLLLNQLNAFLKSMKTTIQIPGIQMRIKKKKKDQWVEINDDS